MGKKRLLVIGGSGFVSGALVRRALAAGHEVWAVTRGQKPLPAGAKHLCADRKDGAAFAAAVESARTEWDAAIDCIGYFEEDALQDISLFRARAAQLIFISTDFVYDPDRRQYPQPEETAYYLQDDSYGAHKRRCELAIIGGDTGQMRWTIFRPCHIYGPGSLLGCLPQHSRDPYLLERLRRREPLKLVGGGHFLQQPIFADDLAALILSAVGNERAYGQIYNAYGPEVAASRDYYALIAAQLGVPLSVVEVPVEAYRRVRPEHKSFLCHRLSSLAKLELHGLAVPSTPLAEGLRAHVRSLLH